MEMKRIFLVGCPRSGTTLLQSLLSAHPKIASYPESHYFRYLFSRWRVLRAVGLPSRSAKDHLQTYADDIKGSTGQVGKIPFMVTCQQYTDYFVGVLDESTASQNKSAWIEKTPDHLRYIQHISRLIEDASFIHIIRNGTDVVASLYDVAAKYPKQWNGPWSVDYCIKIWMAAVRNSQKYLGEVNHAFVRYEDLVSSPGFVLKELMWFIGLEYKKSMLDNYQHQARRVTLSSEPWKVAVTEKIDNSNRSKFLNLFDDKQRAYISEQIGGVDLSVFGNSRLPVVGEKT